MSWSHEEAHGQALQQNQELGQGTKRAGEANDLTFRTITFNPHKKALSVDIPKIKHERADEQFKVDLKKNVFGLDGRRKNKALVILKHETQRIQSLNSLAWKSGKKDLNGKKKEKQKLALKPISLPERNPQLTVSGVSSKLNRIIDDGIYFKLMEFYIKVSIEFTTVFNKLDLDNSGVVQANEIRDYLYRVFPSFLNEISVFVKLLVSLGRSEKILKAVFLAACALIRYENPAGDAKTSILTVDYKKVSSLVQVLNTLFVDINGLPEPKAESLAKRYSGNKEDLEKCFKFVFDEKFEFMRFLRIFPLFLWLNSRVN